MNEEYVKKSSEERKKRQKFKFWWSFPRNTRKNESKESSWYPIYCPVEGCFLFIWIIFDNSIGGNPSTKSTFLTNDKVEYDTKNKASLYWYKFLFRFLFFKQTLFILTFMFWGFYFEKRKGNDQSKNPDNQETFYLKKIYY